MLGGMLDEDSVVQLLQAMVEDYFIDPVITATEEVHVNYDIGFCGDISMAYDCLEESGNSCEHYITALVRRSMDDIDSCPDLFEKLGFNKMYGKK